jgi:hypothetical protein
MGLLDVEDDSLIGDNALIPAANRETLKLIRTTGCC